ncbi:hypothetical protein SYNPS1DRAFT_30906 [Syncephalis pseudoplumigaleata]|uniref:Uncharacterized protein n=1 Tax=Syncephalis pseudoplumigaleata TaxID=1712513 RepID=A0A4P9YU60_9FUNG|nr:hypothetical protein SYNPS1DRAFT_30906 [Syncephalis pseudoplumigaleata]|eukprot:RKP23354.1 hypothetical protein SYNPS1DRAFT_30906 [Syncephalis pseudoplumigaleata]
MAIKWIGKLKRLFAKRCTRRQPKSTAATGHTTLVEPATTFYTTSSDTTIAHSTTASPPSPVAPLKEEPVFHAPTTSRLRIEIPSYMAGRSLASPSADPMAQLDWTAAKSSGPYSANSYLHSGTFNMGMGNGRAARPLDGAPICGCFVAVGLATDIVAERRSQGFLRGLRALLCFPCILSYTCFCWWCAYHD